MRRIALLVPLLVLVPATGVAAGPPTLPGARSCPIFPATSPWNERVDRLPVAADSAALIAAIGLDAPVHPDFGSFAGYGIPYTVVGHSTRRVHVSFEYADESDRGPYPLPDHPRIEGGGDRHVLLLDRDACKLYELFDATRQGASWHAGSGRSGTCARTTCARPAGRAPTPPGFRSFPASCATTRSLPAPSGMRCASPRRGPRIATCGRRATSPATPTRACRRWACAYG